MPESNASPNYQVRSVSRALKILKCFTSQKTELSLSELNELTDLNKSTLIRLLECLIQEEFIVQNEDSAKYHLGLKIFEIGMVYYTGQLKITQMARPFMAALSKELNLTVNLAILDGGEIVYTAIEEPDTVIRVKFSLGARKEASATSMGKVLLAQLSDEKLDELIKTKGLPASTKYSITDPGEFKKHLAAVKERGYAEDNEEALIGVRCIGMPIMDYSGKVMAAMSISGTVLDFTRDRDETVKEALKKTSLAISEKLGYQLI